MKVTMDEQGKVTVVLDATEAVDIDLEHNPLVVGTLRRVKDAVRRAVQLRSAEAYTWGEGRNRTW